MVRLSDPRRTPICASLDLDYLLFAEFPRRKGFWIHGKLDLNHPPELLASLMQSWLYFGLISEFLGVQIDK